MSGKNTHIMQQTAQAVRSVSVKRRRLTGRWDFSNWLARNVRTKAGRWSFAGREPFQQIAQSLHEHEENWFLKGTQIGFSTLMIGWNLYLPHERGLDCAYGLPTKVTIKPFMKQRFTKEQISQNGHLKAAYRLHESDYYYDCGDHFLHFLGMNVLSEMMSRPLEQVSLDEVTIINADQIDWIEDRLGAASFGQKNFFSMEIYPGGNVEKGFQSGKQNVWNIQCRGCGADDIILEELFHVSSLQGELFPSCIRPLNTARTEWQIICPHCSKPLDRAAMGRWVARYPDRDVQSYRLPQIIFEGMNLTRFMRRWLSSHGKKSKRSKIHCSLLAIPDAGDLQGISERDLVHMKYDYPLKNSNVWSVGGCDVGNICHVVFHDLVNDARRLAWVEKINSDHMVEQISRLIENMNCQKFVIDAKPFAPQVRELAARWPGIVVMHDYAGEGMLEQKKEHAGEAYDAVREDRDIALDYYCDLFNPEDMRLMFPNVAPDETGRVVDFEKSEFSKQHLIGSQKVETEDKRLGKMVLKYRKNCENHYFMAGNYARTALDLLRRESGEYVGLMPAFGSVA